MERVNQNLKQDERKYITLVVWTEHDERSKKVYESVEEYVLTTKWDDKAAQKRPVETNNPTGPSLLPT